MRAPRPHYVASSVLAATLLAGAVPGDAAGKPGRPSYRAKPNVVLIVADDIGYADLGFTGGKEVATPNIDALAATGVRFTQSYVTGPVCSPSRAGLLTGRIPNRFGFAFNASRSHSVPLSEREVVGIPPDEIALGTLLKRRGYATAFFGKDHTGYVESNHPLSMGFDEFVGFRGAGQESAHDGSGSRKPNLLRQFEPYYEPRFIPEVITSHAREFIAKHKETPFFLYLPYNMAHGPWQWPPEPFPGRVESGNADVVKRQYLAMIAALDHYVGQVMSELRAHDLERDTLVLFLSDNGGPALGSNGVLRGGKGNHYEGGLRVPFVARWKGVLPEGTTFGRSVWTPDLFVTILKLAGGRPAKGRPSDGVDLLPYLFDEADGRPHQEMFWDNGRQVTLRSGSWKLVISLTAPTGVPGLSRPIEELFDLDADVGESHDLAAAHPELLRSLKTRLRAWRAQMQRPRWVPAQYLEKWDMTAHQYLDWLQRRFDQMTAQ